MIHIFTTRAKKKYNLYLKDELRLEKDVQESKPEQSGHGAKQSSTKVQIASIWSKKGSSREARENGSRQQESVGHNHWVDHQGHVQQGSSAQSGEESESKEKSQSGWSVLAIIRCGMKRENQSNAKKAKEEASTLQKIGEKMGVSSGRGRHNCHCQTSVDTLQMSSDRSFTKSRKIVRIYRGLEDQRWFCDLTGFSRVKNRDFSLNQVIFRNRWLDHNVKWKIVTYDWIK